MGSSHHTVCGCHPVHRRTILPLQGDERRQNKIGQLAQYPFGRSRRPRHAMFPPCERRQMQEVASAIPWCKKRIFSPKQIHVDPTLPHSHTLCSSVGNARMVQRETKTDREAIHHPSRRSSIQTRVGWRTLSRPSSVGTRRVGARE